MGLIWPLRGLTQGEGNNFISATSNQLFFKVNFHILMNKISKLEFFSTYFLDILKKIPFFFTQKMKISRKNSSYLNTFLIIGQLIATFQLFLVLALIMCKVTSEDKGITKIRGPHEAIKCKTCILIMLLPKGHYLM